MGEDSEKARIARASAEQLSGPVRGRSLSTRPFPAGPTDSAIALEAADTDGDAFRKVWRWPASS